MSGESPTALRIGDASNWHFVNGHWQDGEDNLLKVSEAARAAPGASLYQHQYAFHRRLCYKDVRVQFAFRLKAHSDVGIMLRASDESHFHLLHFPNCGQACRAQHFWVALSRMDDTGYLKHVKLEMIRRVPSNAEIWLSADVTLKGNRIGERVGENGYFEAGGDLCFGAGHLGVFSTGGGEIRDLVIEGKPARAAAWADEISQPTNWFNPCPEPGYGPAQMPQDLVRLREGEILLSYTASEAMCVGTPRPFLSSSHDRGRTWSESEPLQVMQEDGGWLPARLNLTPGGRLIGLVKAKEGHFIAESKDRGRTWSESAPVDFGPLPDGMSELHIGPQAFLNLADGAMLLFLYGGHDLADPALTIGNWGAWHCRAYSVRSTDDGHTWSAPVNLDNSAGAGVSGQAGSLDLTEVCAAQMGDGGVMALIRPVYSPWMWETWSRDGGATWGPCVRGPLPGYATPNMLRMASGKVLVAHRLPSLTMHCSPDDGRTWDQGTQIDSALWVMGCMAEVEPDVALYTYCVESLMSGQLIRVTPSGLEPIRRG